MKRLHWKLVLSAALVATGAIAISTYAAATKENDALAISEAKISISQAIAAAEQHVHGKATRAEFEQKRQYNAFEVEVVNGTKVFDVTVDADQGNVLSVAEDKYERDRHEREDD
ncbi:PepSY domain-containing protein [Caballeronia cordobensis]|uniref:PepSY domain-containing protein n=1 Tax=Caballeronia cordobensis TaxID=1353886 RepID=UPI00045F0C4B|nr:putative membrane protein [Burkholderia sp. RPE67]